MIYPPDDRWWVKALRFVNVLDETANKLSPTKLQAWGATLNAIYQAATADFSHVAGVTQAGVSALYAGAAHVLHQTDKREQNLQAVRMK